MTWRFGNMATGRFGDLLNRLHGTTTTSPDRQIAKSPNQTVRILLVGNYPLDAQESMQRFAGAMHDGLTRAGLASELLLPSAWLGRLGPSSLEGIGKWLAYLDKYLVFPLTLRKTLRRLVASGDPVLVHICDHSNAVYASFLSHLPIVVTCHDLLAVRGALGEATDCPASGLGKLLQRWILHGLARSSWIASVSSSTHADVQRLVDLQRNRTRSSTILIGLNHSYQRLSAEEVGTRLAAVPELTGPFVLHVGSNLRRKNREAVLRVFAGVAPAWKGQLVFAGQPLSPPLLSLAESLGITGRIVQIRKPSNDLLEALYNRATALLFPSRFEGFGWPIIEAQACGCPVISSNSGPLPEVVGDGGLLRSVDDEAGMAQDLLRLTEPGENALWQEKSLLNARRFTTERMIHDYLEIYQLAIASR